MWSAAKAADENADTAIRYERPLVYMLKILIIIGADLLDLNGRF